MNLFMRYAFVMNNPFKFSQRKILVIVSFYHEETVKVGWGRNDVIFGKLKGFKVSILISMESLFLTKFIEILTVTRMSLQRDLRLRSIQAEGLRKLIVMQNWQL